MKKIMTVLVIILVLLAAVYIARNVLIKALLVKVVKSTTGLTLSIDHFDVGIVTSYIDVKNMKLYNPPEFEDQLMIDLPELLFDFRFGALLKKKIHIEEMRINLKEFIVVKNSDGAVNLDSLKMVEKKKEETAEKETPKEKLSEEKKTGSLQIDTFDLKIGTVLYKDYSKGKKPEVKTYPLNINERFENITDVSVLWSVILTKALMKTAIPALANFPIDLFKNTAGGVLKGATNLAFEGGEMALKTVGKTVEGTGKTLEMLIPGGKKEK